MIDDEAVCKHASSLNSGRKCTIEHFSFGGDESFMGAANYHARIRFEDGSPSWFLRVPRVATCNTVSISLIEYLVCSEYATLKFLETTAVPAPRVFSYGLAGTNRDHGVGVSFILMEEVAGICWSSGEASKEEKAKVWAGLARILKELEKHPFEKAGSLCFHSSQLQVSKCASDRFLVLDPRGPFSTSTEYYSAFAEQYLELIADGQLYTEYPINAYLVYRFLKDNVHQFKRSVDSDGVERFYLKHVDDKGDHLFVDDQLNITGIIDWQMARVVPREEAFGPSLVTADMQAFCGGSVPLSLDDKVLLDLLHKGGMTGSTSDSADEKTRRFFWGLALETEWKYALPLATAILKCFGVEEKWDAWKEKALKEYETDDGLIRLVGS
ncbi:uncharacterized protein EAE98_005719 [Botrytis deweyae]|uniref:Aminoglycoside phosphotransferase domain-containing protein n=1 Tax=Botrytis deweyae TaxID=2478750 RepID=A0ABQ7IMJ9_9HELO|nr:uncharacterized protein EAE98_005719 [Botrytis deweyae]KAF7928663.1 hypothetical protein EAE98_005719 [Botrytis deweyae]